MSEIKIGDRCGMLKHLETVESIDGEYARFRSGGFWRTAPMLDSAVWFRLPRADEAPDPLFVEVEATIRRLNILPGDGAENALDMVASIADVDSDGDVDALRKALLECAAFCVVGLQDIDRGAL